LKYHCSIVIRPLMYNPKSTHLTNSSSQDPNIENYFFHVLPDRIINKLCLYTVEHNLYQYTDLVTLSLEKKVSTYLEKKTKKLV